LTQKEKELQNDLYFEQERLKLAIKSAEIGLWDWNLVDNSIYFSPEFKEMLGYSDDEIENDFSQWEKRVHPDDIKRTYLDIQENHKKITNEYQNIHRLKHKNGSWIWILDKGKTYFNEKDEPMRMIGFHINVTDDIMLETKYRNLFNQIKEGVLIYKVEDKGNKFTLKDCNEAAQKIDNIDIKDSIGKDILNIFPEIKDIGFLDILKEVYRNGETKVIPSFEYTYNNSQKSWRKYYVYKLINNDIVLIYEDLTKEKLSNIYLETVFNAQSNIVVTTDGDKIDYANHSLLRFLDYKSLDEFLLHYNCICDLFIKRKGYLYKYNENNIMWIDYIYQNPDIVHKVILKKDNKEYTFIINAKKLEYDKKSRNIVVLNDITALEEKDILLMQQSKMAAMGEMLESIAHQWRQPLSVISTTATGIKTEKDLDILTDESLFEYCDNINNSVQHLSQTIDDFRSFLKQDKQKELFYIKDIYIKTINLVSSKFKNRNINIIDNIDNIQVNGFGNELIQVFMNIFNNARDELEILDIKKRILFVDIYKDEENLIIKIKDNAGGIPDNVLPNIFEPYFTTKEERDGTGIGLYMTNKIIKNSFKGDISASNKTYDYENITYTGAEFKITIPLNYDFS